MGYFLRRFTKILDCLQADPRGIIVICNVLDGLRSGLYNASFIKKVLTKWSTYHKARARYERLGSRAWNFDELWKSIEAYHSSLPSPAWWTGSSSADLEMKCITSSPGFRLRRYGCSRSTEQIFEALSDVSNNNLRGRLIFASSTSRYFDDSDVVEEIRALPDGDREFNLKSTAYIPKYGRVLWFTREPALTALCRKADPANSVRDLLGLVHYGDGFAATAVFFGGDELALVRSARPTFGDAATHRRFMMRPRLAKNRRRRGWGMTADLSRIAPASPEYDGLTERVAASFSGSTHAGRAFTLLPLGKTSGNRGRNANDNDDVFAQLLLRNRTIAGLRKALARQGVV
jgi:hypothetical protein